MDIPECRIWISLKEDAANKEATYILRSDLFDLNLCLNKYNINIKQNCIELSLKTF